MLKAGFCELDITPRLGMNIPGYFNKRPATGIKDPLFVKAAVISSDNDKEALVMVVLDSIGITFPHATDIKAGITEQTGIAADRIMVSAIHTHTGGPVIYSRSGQRAGEAGYMDFLKGRAADAAVIAYRRLEPAVMGCGTGSEKDISSIRRFFMKDGTYRTNPPRADPNIDRPDGVIDPDVAVVRIDDLNGRPMAVITNFACHLDCVSGTEFSADYSGELSRTIKSVLGQNVVSIFMTGACGNINHFDFTRKERLPADHYRKMGRILAYEALKVREKADTAGEAALEAGYVCFDAKVRTPSKGMIEEAEKLLAAEEASKKAAEEAEQMTAEGGGAKKPSNYYELYYANEIINLSKLNLKTTEFPIQVFRIGELAITALPGEIFDEFGLEIKKKSPFKCNIINELANAGAGYIPIREAYARGGYEPRLNTYSNVEPETGERMLEEAVKLLNKLGDADR